MTDWTINDLRIFVTDSSSETGQIIARLQPLEGGTINQRFGYETQIRKLGCYVVGGDEKGAIENLVQSGAVVMTSPEGIIGNFLVQRVSSVRKDTISQTLRPDLACDAPVYIVELGLLWDS